MDSKGWFVVNNKIVFFLTTFAAILLAELFQWEIPANLLHDDSGQHYAQGPVSAKSDLQAHDVCCGHQPEASKPIKTDAGGKGAPASVADPVIILLLGCALIGLVGLERKKSSQ
jgi:hypothetical protein